MSVKRQGLVGVPQGDDKGATFTWLLNMDFNGMVPAGLFFPSSQVSSTSPSSFSTLLTACVSSAFVASLSVGLMYLPATYVSDMKEEREKEAKAAAQEQGQDDARLLLAAAQKEITAARKEIAALKAELTALRSAAQQEA